MKKIAYMLACACMISSATLGAELNTQMKAYIDSLKAESLKNDENFKDFDAARGEVIFKTKNIGKDNQLLSCESCHGSDLTKSANNVFTNKTLEPLSPNANSSRLTDVKDVQKWLKRNFKDVYQREGTPLEKGDVLYYILSK
ncbi:DUF1924 domain-containing protein [Campylobacter fetus]|uniref:DUF1924 domain-containing protein n=1 Tax=Campylobacter fetus TaxID=196 RepID=UPI00057DF270|nr:DUF1924 domain-containing protein [Campylobacter fetus]AJB45103.1 cytochrome C protein [Campylobacter fetus subsp. testudinum]ALV64448.1 hypothetical protein (DUF1924 domain) [Campylobacter fetus subsp. testudinum Sp3]AVK80778.1 DUF1924 domain-containing protein [Campylobacter fetus subsp. testudinum]EAK0826828.1 DUF1924 domain-containing protein [Campylobacter fetus]EAK0830472.1 DUF1924 domain-containing protein [Campylobacter fetus]